MAGRECVLGVGVGVGEPGLYSLLTRRLHHIKPY